MTLDQTQHMVFNNYSSIQVKLIDWSIRHLLEAKLAMLLRKSQKMNFCNCISTESIYEKTQLFYLSNNNYIVYRWSLAVELAKKYNLSFQNTALNLLSCLTPPSWNVSDSPKLVFNIQVLESGWIDFILSDRSLAIYLEQFPKISLTKLNNSYGELGISHSQKKLIPKLNHEFTGINTQSKIAHRWVLQYTQSRCSSLLRLGHQQELIKLAQFDFSQAIWPWLEPTPIPWLSPSNTLLLTTPQEQELIKQILLFGDHFFEASTIKLYKLAIQLSMALLNFYDSCQVFGDLSSKNLPLAQSRLGLIALSQWLLQQIMVKHLQILPLEEF